MDECDLSTPNEDRDAAHAGVLRVTSPFSRFFWVGPGDEANPHWGWLSLACETRLLPHCRCIKAAGLWVKDCGLGFSFVSRPLPALFPASPCFYFFDFVCVRNNTRKQKSGEKWESLGANDVRWTQGGCGGPNCT